MIENERPSNEELLRLKALIEQYEEGGNVTDVQQDFVTVASAVAAIALNALWQDALLVLCVWLLLRAWPRLNAATR